MRYASEYKVLIERGKGKVWKRVCKPQKQSAKFKCQTWFEITKKFAKKCLDASSL